MSQGMLNIPLPEESLSVPETMTQRRLLTTVHALLVTASAVVLSSYVILAVAHAKDRYQVNFVSGVYAALAAELNDGRFYPQVYDGSHYAGTRYVPGQFLLHAGLARLTGEYLLSGKLLTYLATLALLVEMFVILRRLGCRRSVSFALLGLVVTSVPGFLACTTIRGDLLPVVLQLAALLIVADELTPRRAAFAGLCCTLAILTKFSADLGPGGDYALVHAAELARQSHLHCLRCGNFIRVPRSAAHSHLRSYAGEFSGCFLERSRNQGCAAGAGRFSVACQSGRRLDDRAAAAGAD